nr:hypothetical protein [Candidatus Sigynarchaeum springense]
MPTSITFTGTVQDYDSHWYYGFFRVKPDEKIPNPNVKAGASTKLVYLIDKKVHEITGLKGDDGSWQVLIGARVRVTGYWFTMPLKDRHYFEITALELLDKEVGS